MDREFLFAPNNLVAWYKAAILIYEISFSEDLINVRLQSLRESLSREKIMQGKDILNVLLLIKIKSQETGLIEREPIRSSGGIDLRVKLGTR